MCVCVCVCCVCVCVRVCASVCRYQLPQLGMDHSFINYSKKYIHSSKSWFVSSFATASVGAYLVVELFVDLQDGSHVSASVFVRGGCCREWGLNCTCGCSRHSANRISLNMQRAQPTHTSNVHKGISVSPQTCSSNLAQRKESKHRRHAATGTCMHTRNMYLSGINSPAYIKMPFYSNKTGGTVRSVMQKKLQTSKIRKQIK